MLEATNHLPRFHGTDAGIWRRIRLVPFTQRIPEEKQDMLLPQKLEAELPGILNWALDGLSRWLRNSQGGKRHGLPACPEPPAVRTDPPEKLSVWWVWWQRGLFADFSISSVFLFLLGSFQK